MMVKNSIYDIPRKKKFDGDTFEAAGIFPTRAAAAKSGKEMQNEAASVGKKLRVRVSAVTIHVLYHGPEKKFVLYTRM